MGRVLVLGASLAVWLAAVGQSGQAQVAAVTFNRDVAPILYAHCTGCHRPGQIAPMSLLGYEEARPWARSIRRMVSERRMPPWFADPHVGKFSNDASLTDRDIDLITRWVDSGAAQGDPADRPPLPQYAEGWRIGTPDVMLPMAAPFNVPASGIIDYQYFEIPTNLTEDRWVQAIEIQPSDRRVVHHALVFARGPQDPVSQASPGGPKCSGAVCGDIDTADLRFGYMLSASALGTQPDTYPAGTAKLLKAGSILTLQVHYTTMGKATSDRTTIGLVFSKAPPRVELKTVPLTKESFVIPARAANHLVEANLGFQADALIWSIAPHTHLRGKSWRVDVVPPGGAPQPLLSVPRYDFHWQLNYLLAQPLEVKKGTRLHAEAIFDNSPLNPNNPNPNVDVHWGGQTTDEMMFSSIVYSVQE
jgi:hypothetical protein